MVEKLPLQHGERQLALSTMLARYQELRDCVVAKELSNESGIAPVTEHLDTKPHKGCSFTLP
jgi:hypothetical protein